MNNSRWQGLDSAIAAHIESKKKERLAAYSQSPSDILEHANIERATAQGGYGRRQIYELVQNGADALAGFPDGRIEVVLTRQALYCANEGEPITIEGVDTILASHVSRKRGTEIGRFGLGFKSVLGVTDRPEFYSRSGSFGFDPEISRQLILEIQPDAQKLPKLRIAQPLCAQTHADEDVTLRDLMERASTVVKLPLLRGLDWLPTDLREFPAEFLLFSPHVGTLVLKDLSQMEESQGLDSARTRRITAQVWPEKSGSGERVTLDIDGEKQEWTVFKTLHRPSALAKEDGGELADREELPIMWAVPRAERPSRSKFWAFFPTHTALSLSGILNAPWKTNEDRQNVLESRFNDEMLRAAAELVIENLPHLVPQSEPCRYLELLPSLNDAEGADKILGDCIYRSLSERPCLPDQNGTLQSVTDVKLHPPLSREALDIWSSYDKRPSHWVHASVETQRPRARALYLMRLGGQTPETLKTWLEALVADRSLNASACALRVAAAALQADPKLRGALNEVCIVKKRDGQFAPPQPGTLFLARTDGSTPANSPLALVHPDLAGRAELKEVWETLGIREVEQTSQLESLLLKVSSSSESGLRSVPWDAFWKTVRGIPIDTVLPMMRESLKNPFIQLWVVSKAKMWRPLGKVLLPGAVLSDTDEYDFGCLIDLEFHATDEAILKSFGATDRPKPGCEGGSEAFIESYREEKIEQFYDTLDSGSRPQKSFLNFGPGTTTGPLDVYALLNSAPAKARFCVELLPHVLQEELWALRHDTRREYTPLPCPPPSQQLLLTQGVFPTSQGLTESKDCFGLELKRWEAVLPVVQLPVEQAGALSLPTSFDTIAFGNLVSLGRTIEAGVREHARDTRLLSEFYALLASRGALPDEIVCRLGEGFEKRPRAEVWVESSPEKVALIISDYPGNGHLHTSPDQAKVLIEKWGLKRASFNFEIVAERADDPTPLLDRFSGFYALAEAHPEWELESFELVPCLSLSRDTLLASGRNVKPQEFVRDGKTLFFTSGLSPLEVLERVVKNLNLPLSDEQKGEVLTYQTGLAGKAKLLEVRRASNHAAKLVAALGAKAIRGHLPPGLEDADRQRLKAQGKLVADERLRVAELALAVYGVDTLKEFRGEFETAGLEPPARWAGSHAARKWVAMLGFPATYAGFEGALLSRLEEVDGPPELPLAHDFQLTMMTAIRLLNAQDGTSKRGLLSLPTGAGKTRTAVEALVEAVREDGLTRAATPQSAGRLGPILWIAQSEELCEQAVVTWKWVWSAKGPRERLTISRLWSSNEADPVAPAPQVVVATIDKLQRLLLNPDYEWLSQAAFVVIDEAHFATSRQYTEVLGWLGLTWHDMKRGNDRCPLLGLTATAFKGSLEGTKSLARRFDFNRLDYEAWDDNPFPYLQEMGILSRVEHEELESTRALKLSDAQREYADKFGVLPADFEKFLAMDTDRNAKILAAVRAQPADWPMLLFATSVAHAQTLAALLQTEGISAAAISGATPTATRRYAIEEFRRGRIRVLTNYNVLTTGFDAPSVRCVLIARPTYSPVLYQQMIGRGLRGPKNGGKEVCKIIDVKDNIINYQQDLAFLGFEHLWKPEKLREISAEEHGAADIDFTVTAAPEEVETFAVSYSPADVDDEAGESPANADPQASSASDEMAPVGSSVMALADTEAEKLNRRREVTGQVVQTYCEELCRRWPRLNMPLGKVLAQQLGSLGEVEAKGLKEWQDTAFDALQKEATRFGVRANQLPWPRR